MVNHAVTKHRRWTAGALEFVSAPASPLGAECVTHHSCFLVTFPAVASFFASCAPLRRTTLDGLVGCFAKLFNVLYYVTGLERFLVTSCLRTSLQLKILPSFVVHFLDLTSPKVVLFPYEARER